MSSMIRRLQRRIERSRPDYEPKPQPTKVHASGGYSTLTATKGWKVFSALRLNAQRKMAAILDHFIAPRPKKRPKVWRKPGKPVPNTITRQQIRYARRKGLPIPTAAA